MNEKIKSEHLQRAAYVYVRQSTVYQVRHDDGIYDPKVLNDRLLLGLKGTMSEFELGLMRQRARQAYTQKVRRGEAMWELPVGFVRSRQGVIEKTPDHQVQQAIERWCSQNFANSAARARH